MKLLVVLLYWALASASALGGQDGIPGDYKELQQRMAETSGQDAQADKHVVEDRKAERDFKYKALVALSSTTALLYVLSIFVLNRLHEKPSATHIVNITSLALIVYGALVLSLTASTHEGLTATVGIFGALAGYLFGQVGQKADAPNKRTGDG